MPTTIDADVVPKPTTSNVLLAGAYVVPIPTPAVPLPDPTVREGTVVPIPTTSNVLPVGTTLVPIPTPLSAPLPTINLVPDEPVGTPIGLASILNI
jgi:hypothetical protein